MALGWVVVEVGAELVVAGADLMGEVVVDVPSRCVLGVTRLVVELDGLAGAAEVVPAFGLRAAGWFPPIEPKASMAVTTSRPSTDTTPTSNPFERPSSFESPASQLGSFLSSSQSLVASSGMSTVANPLAAKRVLP